MSIKDYLLSPFTDHNQKRSSHGDSLYSLDGLRGLAVLIVLMSHTSAFGMYAQGSLGVLLFYFLSGFVLTLPYIEEPKKLLNKKEFFKYATNRFLRLVPIYVVAITIYALYSGNDFNWFLYHVSFIKGENHFWSVAQEARFYILFPIVIVILALIPKYSLRILILCILIYYTYKYKGIHTIDMLHGRNVAFYFWMFLGGSLASMIYASSLFKNVKEKAMVKNTLSIGAVIVLLSLFLTSNHMIATLWHPLFPSLPDDLKLNGWRMPDVWFTLFLILLISVTTYSNTTASKFLQSPLLRHLGLLSYSMYLFHMLILKHLSKYYGLKSEGLFVAVLVITWFISIISYLTIEKPFLMLKSKSTKKKTL